MTQIPNDPGSPEWDRAPEVNRSAQFCTGERGCRRAPRRGVQPRAAPVSGAAPRSRRRAAPCGSHGASLACHGNGPVNSLANSRPRPDSRPRQRAARPGEARRQITARPRACTRREESAAKQKSIIATPAGQKRSAPWSGARQSRQLRASSPRRGGGRSPWHDRRRPAATGGGQRVLRRPFPAVTGRQERRSDRRTDGERARAARNSPGRRRTGCGVSGDRMLTALGKSNATGGTRQGKIVTLHSTGQRRVDHEVPCHTNGRRNNRADDI